ncbi:TatD family hydrolase [Bacteroidia bacterium]|nr:TatD family hydrolase [Bacteroidia bacterium]
MTTFIDSHTHIYSEEFDSDRGGAIERALCQGVTQLILPDTGNKSRARILDTCDEYPGVCFPLLGIHPTEVGEDYRDELHSLEAALDGRQIYGIGECGLDLYWDTTFYKEQITVFERQIAIAECLHLPLVIHSRNAMKEVIGILEKHPRVKGIIHCFSGDVEDAKKCIDMGYLLGIGGIVTFKNSHLPGVLQEIGSSALVLETDAPYLAPVPHRGKRNESSYIPLIAGKVAEILDEDIKNIAEITTQNAMGVFSLVPLQG